MSRVIKTICGLATSIALSFATLTAQQAPVIGTWNVVPSPNVGANINLLRGVTALSSTDVWAVGQASPPTGGNFPRRPMIQHWDGAQWSVIPSPDPPVSFTANDKSLRDVDHVSANDIWAVGALVDTGSFRAESLIEHWDGTAWSIVPAPQVGIRSELHGVTVVSTNDVWAVGEFSEAGTGTSRALTIHWDGATWSMVPNPGGNYSDLLAVDAVAANDIWAVGNNITLHWDGVSWSRVPFPYPPTGGSGSLSVFLNGVSARASDDVWAVGNSVTCPPIGGCGSLPEIYRWNGAAWTRYVPPLPGTVLYDVVAIADDDVWAVGADINGIASDGPNGGMILHWDGASWQRVFNPVGPASELFSISAISATDIWAVGRLDRANTLTERYTVGSPSPDPVQVVLSRDAGNQIRATTTITNPTANPVADVTVTLVRISTLDGSRFVDGLPLTQSFGTIDAGQSVTATVTFPGTAGVPAGITGLARVDLSFAGGAYTDTEQVVTP